MLHVVKLLQTGSGRPTHCPLKKVFLSFALPYKTTIATTTDKQKQQITNGSQKKKKKIDLISHTVAVIPVDSHSNLKSM